MENARAMPTDPLAIREILADRAGEAMALNDRHLNPQLGRIVRTLGFDRTWVAGEGAHLIDDTGAQYLDQIHQALSRQGCTLLAVRERPAKPYKDQPFDANVKK